MMTVQPREICTAQVPSEDEKTLPGQNPSSERIPGAVPDDLAARVRVLRRARRDARTRASRVRRVLLAPTLPGDRVRVPK